MSKTPLHNSEILVKNTKDTINGFGNSLIHNYFLQKLWKNQLCHLKITKIELTPRVMVKVACSGVVYHNTHAALWLANAQTVSADRTTMLKIVRNTYSFSKFLNERKNKYSSLF